MVRKLSTIAKRRHNQTTPIVLAYDLGTSGVKCVALNGFTAEVEAISPVESYPTQRTDDGHIKQEPNDWIGAIQKTTANLKSTIKLDNVVAIGISGHMHAGVWLGSNWAPLGPVSMWNCPRAAQEGARLSERAGAKIDRRLTISHIAYELNNRKDWWLKNVSGFTTCAGWVGGLLTGQHALGLGDYSGLGIADLDKHAADPARMELLDDPQLAEKAPAPIAAGSVYGLLSYQGAQLLGLPWPRRIIVAAPEGDQPAGSIGLGVIYSGTGSFMLGTSGVLNFISDRGFTDPTMTIDFFNDAFGKHLNMGLIVNCCHLLDLVRDQYLPQCQNDLQKTYDFLNSEARKTAVDCGGALRLHLPDAESFLGLTQPLKRDINVPADPSPGLVWRMAMNSVALLLRQRLQSLSAGGVPRELVVGGGASKNPLFMQTLADCLGIRLRRPENSHLASAIGAGLLGALAEERFFGDAAVPVEDFIAEAYQAGKQQTWEPNSGNKALYDQLNQVFCDEVTAL